METSKAKKTFFIADVHLSADGTRKRSLVLSFLNMVKQETGDLYILGDFFEFWANNAAIVKLNLDIMKKLHELTTQGLSVGFLFGNRDFLINRRSLAPFGVDFLGEETIVLRGDKRLFLCHGHTLCLSDVSFLSYKQRVWPLFRLLDRIVPGPIENFIARKCIIKSKQVIESQKPGRLDFTMSEIHKLFDTGMDAVICGHAHRLEQHDQGTKHFYALPAWEENLGYYLLLEDDIFSLHEFTDSGARPLKQS